MGRDVNSLLNMVCPDNVATIIERVASTEVRSVEELQLIIGLIFKKSLAEPHYCETYADMVFALKQRKDRARANMKFIGQLFLRALLGTRIIESVIRDMAKCSSEATVPEEPIVECLCELLTNIGFTLEAAGGTGQSALNEVCIRLQNLKKHYSKRVQFAIQDVLDIRSAGWKKKTFKPAAKRKDEIRREQEMELRRVASGQEVGASEVQIAGARRPAMGW